MNEGKRSGARGKGKRTRGKSDRERENDFKERSEGVRAEDRSECGDQQAVKKASYRGEGGKLMNQDRQRK